MYKIDHTINNYVATQLWIPIINKGQRDFIKHDVIKTCDINMIK
jgi:hypothetical protein